MASETPQPIYVDDEIRILEGEDAAAPLRERLPVELGRIDSERGVTRVDEERWREAQRYERRTWMERGRDWADDRNGRHAERFAGYRVLEGCEFRRAIELGCGPFTNLRFILDRCRADEVHLLDPLLEDYLGHPHCTYKTGFLRRQSDLVTGGRLAPRRWARSLRRLIRRRTSEQPIPVTTAPLPIERYDTDRAFDLVVMINVIEHCQDAERVFAKVDELLAPGGVFVYHDKMYSAAALPEFLANVYDAGHPLRVDHRFVDRFLEGSFEPLMRAEYAASDKYFGQYKELYFIGRKTPS